MSIATYPELQAAVKNWLHRTGVLGADDATDVVPDLITIGERRLMRDARHKTMEHELSVLIAAGSAPVPTDYVALKNAYLDGYLGASSERCHLESKSVEYIYSKYPYRTSSYGKPTCIARERTNFIFGPYAEDGYYVKGTYYRRLTALAASGNPNDLFLEAPDLYLFAALQEAKSFAEEDTPVIGLWEGKYQSILTGLNSEERAESLSGSALTMRTDQCIYDGMRN